jgi:hypothetical protein
MPINLQDTSRPADYFKSKWRVGGGMSYGNPNPSTRCHSHRSCCLSVQRTGQTRFLLRFVRHHWLYRYTHAIQFVWVTVIQILPPDVTHIALAACQYSEQDKRDFCYVLSDIIGFIDTHTQFNSYSVNPSSLILLKVVLGVEHWGYTIQGSKQGHI